MIERPQRAHANWSRYQSLSARGGEPERDYAIDDRDRQRDSEVADKVGEN